MVQKTQEEGPIRGPQHGTKTKEAEASQVRDDQEVIQRKISQLKASKTKNFKAGTLQNKIHEWRKLTNDQWILDTVKGYSIEFWRKPFQNLPPSVTDFGKIQNKIVDQEIENLLQKEAISECEHENDEFLSNIFLVKKKNGEFRTVINLKNLNNFIEYHHFKMETIETVLNSVQRHSYFISLDLQNAYFSLPVIQSHRKFLKFEWKGKLYQFNCLCFRISSAPRVFTKLMKVVFSHIRRLGIVTFYYIDDSLLEAGSPELCLEQANILMSMFENLGFFINHEKSNLIPSTKIEYLGHVIDSVEFKVFLPEEKIQKILKFCTEILNSENLTIRVVARLIGLFTSAKYAIRLAPLFYRYLNRDKVHALNVSNDNFDAKISLSVEAITEVKWWENNIVIKNGKDIRPGKISNYIETDASKIGWGALFEGTTTGGRWTEQESLLHINLLELKAVYFALQSLCSHLHNTHLCIKSDNSTTVAYLNNQGGSIISLFLQAKSIWLWCEERNIFITAVHIMGKTNTTADFMSRHFSDSTEWKLNEKVFDKVCKVLFLPDIDLFASRLNKQLTKYVSWFPEPKAVASDAFSISWSDLNPYIFPPFSLLSKVLQKIKDYQVRQAILIVPMWTSQPWYPSLLNLLTCIPKMLPNVQNLLYLVHNKQCHSLSKRKLFLVACKVSGIISEVKVFQKSLSNLSVNLGKNPPTSNTILFGTSGIFGVIKGKSIPYTHLKVKF